MLYNGHLQVVGQIKGLKFEQLATDPVSPALSQSWYNTTSKELKYYDGTSVQVLSTGSGSLTQFLKLDGTSPMTGDLQLSSDDQSAAADNVAVSKGHVDSGLALKQDTITGAATTIVDADLDVSRAVVSDGSGKVAASATTAAQIGYLSTLTSDVQDQLDSKQGDLGYTPLNKAGDSMSGTLAMNNNEITGVGAPTAPNSAVRLIDLQNQAAGLDFQHDVVGDEADFTNVAGRYIYIDGSQFSTGVAASAGDIVVVDADGEILSVAYDISVSGTNGALVWNTTTGSWYNLIDGSWESFGGLSGVNPGIGLSASGNTLNVNLGAGVAELPTDEIGIDVLLAGGLFTTVDGTTASTASAAQLAIKLDGGALALSGSGLTIAPNGVQASHIDADVLGNGLQGGSGTEISVQVVADGGILAGTSGIEIDDVELRTRVLYRDGAQAMTGPLTLSSADQSADSNTTAISKGYATTLIGELAGEQVTELQTRLEASFFVFEELTTPATSFVVTHNIGTKGVNVTIYDENDEVLGPDTITATTVNSITVTFASAQLCRIVVSGLKAAA